MSVHRPRNVSRASKLPEVALRLPEPMLRASRRCSGGESVLEFSAAAVSLRALGEAGRCGMRV